MSTITKLMLGGDVMLGRIVKETISKYGYDKPLEQITPLLQQADLTIVNLECAITDSNQLWQGAPKYFYFGAPPTAAKALQQAGVDLVSLANNHCLDFDFQGLQDTFKYLREQHILFAGAGDNWDEATQPVIIEKNNIKFGMVAFCDHQQDFIAEISRPGMAYLDLTDQETALKQFEDSLNAMNNIGVEFPILSLHWGPNMVDAPSTDFIDIAHKVIDMGYKLLFGHSAHVFHGIEIYKGCPIFYACGDLVDDYWVDPDFRNDHQLLFEVELNHLNLSNIKLYPVFIDYCTVRPAIDNEFNFIYQRAKRLCAAFGHDVQKINQHQLQLAIDKR